MRDEADALDHRTGELPGRHPDLGKSLGARPVGGSAQQELPHAQPRWVGRTKKVSTSRIPAASLRPGHGRAGTTAAWR